ncbi:hypothetical protein PanWU01x14_188630 [Parasponia andersonii]|uniref:Transmembrane protein n=1 Tax=Parasponia andersonii TaxID=3476 RepID=A0A2P5C2Y3_PARAD|nr:hypothetical protein PanWU01x14_188630 [Parasponia andersonii]
MSLLGWNKLEFRLGIAPVVVVVVVMVIFRRRKVEIQRQNISLLIFHNGLNLISINSSSNSSSSSSSSSNNIRRRRSSRRSVPPHVSSESLAGGELGAAYRALVDLITLVK